MTLNHTTENLNITDATLRCPDAYSQMMHRCYSRVYLTALAIVRQPEMAEDIAQETFLRAWLKRDSVRDPALLLQPWLIRIARNLSIDWLRIGQQRSRVLPLISLEDIPVEPADYTAPTPRQAAGQAELNAQISDAMMTLPDELRQAVLLHYVEGMNPSDIARMNGEAPSTVTRRLDRARDLLRQHMENGLIAGLATLKPRPRSLEKALAVFAAAVVLPAVTQASIVSMVADTPTPPLVDPAVQLQPLPTSKETGLVAKLGLTKGFALAAATLTAAAVIGGGAIMVQSARNNASDSNSGSISAETKVAALYPTDGRGNASAQRVNPPKTFLGRLSNADKRNLTISGSDSTGNSTSSSFATEAFRTPAGSASTSESQVSVSGVVYDEGTSEPLAGVLVQLLDDNVLKHSTTSTAEGRYAFMGVATTGDWILNARLTGYLPLPVSGYTSRNGQPTIPVRIPSGSKAVEKSVPMLPAVSVSGQVTNSAGHGIGGAPLIWRGTREFTPDDYVVTTSTADGSFNFSTLPFQQGFVDVSAQGFAFFRSHELNLSDRNLADLRFSLEPGATARGTVKNKAGAPVAGAILSMQDQFSLGTGVRFDNRKLASTDSAGAFSMGSLIPGKRTVRVFADGYAPAYFHPELAAGQHQDGVEVVLDEGLTIEGRVVGPEGEATTAHINIGGGMTQIMGEGMGSRPVQKTLSDGSFILRGFSSGTVTLSVISHNPQRNKQVPVQAGDKDVLVKMDGEVAMHAVVLDSKTKLPVEQFTVTNVGEHFKKGEPAGGFRFFIEPGHSMFPTVTAEGYVTEKFEVVAPKGVAEANVTLEIGVGAAVSGRVVSATTRDPIADVAVAAFDSTPFGDSPLGTSVTDKEGRFLIANVPGNKLKIKAMPQSPMAHETVTLEIIDGEITDAGDIAVSAGGRIFGKVVTSDSGAPPKSVQVFFSGPEGTGSTWTWTPLPPSGTFNYPGLKPGKYKVGADASSYEVDLKPGEEREVIVTLGQVKMSGTISVNGETTETGIRARNLVTGQISAGRQNPPKGYIMTNLQPGPHEITLINSPFDETPPVHSEIYDVPNQETVQKDFRVP